MPLNYIKKAAGVLVAVHAAMSAMPGLAQNQIVMIDNFSNGVNFNISVLQNNTWTRTKSNNGSLAAASTYNGNAVMKIDDPGGVNGVYAIYPGIVPAAGDYRLRCTAKFVEFPIGSGTNVTYDAFSNYQIMVTVNGGHRVGSNALVTPAHKSESIKDIHLTAADETAKPPVTLKTNVFTAPANAGLCISFGTYEDFNSTFFTKGGWGGSYILIDDIELVPDPEPTIPVSLSGWELE